MAEIGFIGLGTMGSAMARRLVDAGHTVRVAETAAEQVGVSLPTASALRSVFEKTIARPGGEKLDWAAIAEISRTSVSPS
jgi:3-hydroxyisobutyrate dehydrogenase-like beta-hydroxyacid dehydrogenase